MKLKNKIFWYSSFLYIVISILITITIYFTFSHLTFSREIDRMQADLNDIMTGVYRVDDQFPINDLLGVYVPSNGMIQIYDEQGDQMSMITAGDEVALANVAAPFETGSTTGRMTVDGTVVAYVQTPAIWQDGEVVYVQLYENLSSVQENLAALRIVLILVNVVVVIPVLISGRFLSDLIVKPIQTLTKTMQDIRESSEFKHIEVNEKSQDELYTMSRTFNEMIDLLKENYEKQEAFVSNASHELRTPITIIESYANLVKRRGLEKPELVMESIEAIHAEAIRMRDLTEQLLMLARREKDWQLDLAQFSLREVVTQTAGNVEKSYGRIVNIDGVDDEAMIYSDQQKVKQLLYIFLDNARKYSEEPIDVSLEAKDDGFPVIIKDRGIGIPEKAIEKVFDRFYRVDEARNRDVGGTGLGLSLASDLADALNVEIDLRSQVGQGTTVILTFPSSNSH